MAISFVCLCKLQNCKLMAMGGLSIHILLDAATHGVYEIHKFCLQEKLKNLRSLSSVGRKYHPLTSSSFLRMPVKQVTTPRIA